MADERNGFNSGRLHKKDKKIKRGGMWGALVLLTMAALAVLGYKLILPIIPNFEHIPMHEYYGEAEGEIQIIFGGERVSEGNPPVLKDGQLYLPVDFIGKYLDPYIFWDEKADRLTVTTESKVIRMNTEDLNYFVNNESLQLNLPNYNISGEAYMPEDLLKELYHVEISYKEEYGLAIVDLLSQDREIYTVVAKKGTLRYQPDLKSPIEETLVTGELAEVFSEDGDYYRVRTGKGLLGYIIKEQLAYAETIQGTELPPVKAAETAPVARNGKINLLWDQVTRVEASADKSRRVIYKGLDVICPTWFSFDMDNPDSGIINIADRSYVDFYHQNGIQVWGLISDNFNSNVSHAILTDTAVRENVIRQLLSFASMYDLDGINIDFEMVREADASYYIQFLRELGPLLREQGDVLSVDMYVPKNYNLYYNRTEVGKVADYVVIMAYDEHHSTSKVAGPVASIGFVEEGVRLTLNEVPKEKVILGIPYFVRVWREDAAGDVSSKAYTMDYAYTLFSQQEAEFVWDEETQCYYGEYTVDEDGEEVTYKVWMEEELSIEQKLKVMEDYDLAGIAGWKKGLEKNIIWDLLYSYLKE